ncbi:MAG: L-glutamate gamma-semialdehyde dehydrogenase [Phaeodactylibacter sp.]|nr:L-glutamate gamma-semialdehyde dehydrogenase [Phaeodactylibacter sp.]
MANAYFKIPTAINEPVLSYAPGSPERKALKKALADFKSRQYDVPMTIGGHKVRTERKLPMHPPHELSHTLGHFYKGGAGEVKMAIDAAMKAKPAWEKMPWQERAAIFLKAADLIAGPYRQRMNAASMIVQSKTVFQAEIDIVAELCDFWRFNAQFMAEIYGEQPLTVSGSGIWNRMEYRPLEGFIFALTPFNFASIAGNLPTAPAMMGNTVVWKSAESVVLVADLIMEVLEEAGLPPGVINLVFVDGPVAGEVVFSDPDYAGIHFTGSTGVFQNLWGVMGQNISKYKSYPRIVGETGGKDFIIAHPSADARQVATAITRGAFEFQGQKCSAVSRVYLPKSQWETIKSLLLKDLASIKMGNPEDFSNFMAAVIDEKAFDKISSYIAEAMNSNEAEVIAGGGYDKSKGYFIEPTIIEAKNPKYRTMCEEIFGPVLTVYIYDDEKYEDTLELLNNTSPYALTGAVFSKERAAVVMATEKLRQAAGNFYINDKPTGAVVGQQPFGGARGSGTNDKAGSILNLYRWVSARAIKENFIPPTDYRYPFMAEE